MIELERLFKAGVHFGHQKKRWCPKMEPYIWGYKNNVHLIDISKTAIQLEKAAQFLKDIASQGQTVLWVGTKKAAQDAIQSVAKQVGMPFVGHRWIGGTLTNFAQVKKSVTKYLHYKDILEKTGSYPHYTKKELNGIQKSAARLDNNVAGIVHLVWPVSALVVVDVIKERSAIKEARAMGVPVIALVDTNADPSLVDYVIPTNDDSPRAIQVIIDYLGEAVAQGKVVAEKTDKKVEKIFSEQQLKEEATVAFDDLDDVDEDEDRQQIAKKAKIKVSVESESDDVSARAPKKREVKRAAVAKPAAKRPKK